MTSSGCANCTDFVEGCASCSYSGDTVLCDKCRKGLSLNTNTKLECASTMCDGQVISSDGSSCLDTCPNGQYLDVSENRCAACTIESCSLCVEVNESEK